jgi:hypothetical protein
MFANSSISVRKRCGFFAFWKVTCIYSNAVCIVMELSRGMLQHITNKWLIRQKLTWMHIVREMYVTHLFALVFSTFLWMLCGNYIV